MNGFDFGVFNSLDHDLPTEEYELVEFDQPSVDELLNFINGSGNNPNPNAVAQQQQQLRQVAAVAGISIKQCRLHGQQQEYLQEAPVADTVNTTEDPTSSSSSKKKKKKKKKKSQSSTPSADFKSAASSQSNDTAASASASNSEANNTVERRSSQRQEPASSCRGIKNAQDLEEMLRLAAQNPSAVFHESQFEDEDDKEMDEQIESFRLALESAHLDSLAKRKRKPRVQFAPQDVFRSTLVASQRESVQRVIT